ncbi:MAG: V-type ATP synthase subunit F [Firmicutes bacterium]|nr:V-type ATP synthase subunit F [Bacillota bacterium]
MSAELTTEEIIFANDKPSNAIPTEMRFAAVGDKDSVLAFRALGIDVFNATDAEEIKKTITKLDRAGYGMIFVTEKEAMLVTEFLAQFDSRPYPIVLSIPDGQGEGGYSIQKIIKNMERAIGSSAALK